MAEDAAQANRTIGQKFDKPPEKFDMMNAQRRRASCLLLLLMTVPLGLAWRMVPLGLSPFFLKYGGSVLWAAALYWFVGACLPRLDSLAVAWIGAAAAAALEFSRLWHTPLTDAFRVSLAGRILLGRYFSWKNIAAYWLAIALVALVDEFAVRRGMAQSRASRL